MIRNININSDKISCNFTDLTKNTIIFCANEEIKSKLAKEFYEVISEKECNGIIPINYERTSIINLRTSQTIILTTEHGFLLTAKKPEDIWFVDSNNNNLVTAWAFTEFILYKDIWKRGLLYVYKCFIDGQFGIM